ncbi:MAG: hypothetical protein OER82_01990 [Nitrosopumilus sp.]|nr:hypothetical protein [Nitrosopumilus sp.]
MNVKKLIEESRMKQCSKTMRIGSCDIFSDISFNYWKNIANAIKFARTKTDREDYAKFNNIKLQESFQVND